MQNWREYHDLSDGVNRHIASSRQQFRTDLRYRLANHPTFNRRNTLFPNLRFSISEGGYPNRRTINRRLSRSAGVPPWRTTQSNRIRRRLPNLITHRQFHRTPRRLTARPPPLEAVALDNILPTWQNIIE